MAEKIELRAALRFLSQLQENNNKPWFDKNREHYEQAAAQFEHLVAELIARIGVIEDLEGITPRDCIMRIFRDVRFSKDKSPYKTGFGAGIVAGGRKSGRSGYHIHLAPGHATMVAGGLWEPTPQQLSRFRHALDDDAAPFTAILARGAFKRHFGTLTGEKLKTVPQGYTADNPHIDLLRYKQVCVMEKFDDEVVVSARFPDVVLESVKAMKPFIDYLNQVTQ